MEPSVGHLTAFLSPGSLAFHRGDIPRLVQEYLDSHGPDDRVPRLHPDAARLLAALPWHGGWPELAATLDLLAASPEREVRVSDVAAVVSLHPATDLGPRPCLRDATRHFERTFVRAALDRNGGVVQKAAAELGLHPPNLHRKLRRLGLAAGRRRSRRPSSTD